MAFMAIAMSLLASAGRADYVGTAVLYQADGQYSGGYGGEFNTTLTYSGTSSLKAAAQYSPVQLDSAVGGVGTGSSTVAVFQTFCIQEGSNDVTFSPGTYYAATIETTAYNSNSPPPPNDTQTVSPITAALFSAFWNGTLSGYNYVMGADRSASASELQTAIWVAQGDNTWDGAANDAGIGGNSSDIAQAQAFYTWGSNNPDVSGDVQILGLYDSQADAILDGQSGIHQAQLVEIGNSHNTASVPLPSAGAEVVVLVGVAGLYRMARRVCSPG
jgi:hypothetical protein